MRVLFSVLALIVLAGLSAQAQKVQGNAQFQSPKDRENQRLQAVMDWAKKAHPTQQQLMYKIYEPILLGCRKDYPKVLQMAQTMDSRADDTQSKGQEKSAAQYRTAARLYEKLAEQYSVVVTSFENKNIPAMKKAFDAIPKLEAKIVEATGKSPKRDWVLPTDFAPTPAPAAKKPAVRAVPRAAAKP